MNINRIISERLEVFADKMEGRMRLTADVDEVKEIIAQTEAVTEFAEDLQRAIATEKLLNRFS